MVEEVGGHGCRCWGALTLILQRCISIMTSQPKADQNLREGGGEGGRVTNHRTKSSAVNAADAIMSEGKTLLHLSYFIFFR